jgi:hypothetical protein
MGTDSPLINLKIKINSDFARYRLGMLGLTSDGIALVLTAGTAAFFIAVIAGIGIWLQRWSVKDMPTATVLVFPPQPGESGANDPDWLDALGPVPELPKVSQRWTVRRKAAVIEAVRGGWMPIEEACALYNI